jgi:hypothetical protein
MNRKVNEKMNGEIKGKCKQKWLANLFACVFCALCWCPTVSFADNASQGTTETAKQKEARETAAWKLLTNQRNLDTDLLSTYSILTRAKKKNPKIFTAGTDLQILTFGKKKTLPEPYTFTACPDEISLALGISLPYHLFEVNSNGTIVKDLGVLKMKKGEISWPITTHKNSYIIKETPIVVRKNNKYRATTRKSLEITMSALKKLLAGSTKLILNGADTMAVIVSSSIAKSKTTGTLDLAITKLPPKNYGLSSNTAMVFDLADLGKLGSNVTLYIGAAGLGLGGKTLTIYGVNSQGKAVAIGTTTVSKAKEIAKIIIKAGVAAAIGKAKL